MSKSDECSRVVPPPRTSRAKGRPGYYSARLPDGKVIPFCAVAGENGPGLPKSPGRPGFAALEDSSASVFVTGQFR